MFAPTARHLFSVSRLLSSKASHYPTTTITAAIHSTRSSNTYINNNNNASTIHANMSIKSIPFSEAVTHRRSVYGLTSELTVPAARVVELAELAAKNVPSAFNSQTARLVVLLGDEHKRFWNDVVGTTLQGKPALWENLKGKVEGFAGAAGSILFYENTKTIKQMQERTPSLASLFPEWSEHSSGMFQYALWVALEAEGMGANLQHFNFDSDIEKKAAETFKLPGDELKLRAQLVFGKPADGAWPTTPKEKLPTSETVKVFGKF